MLNPTATVCYHTCEDTPDDGIGSFKLSVRNQILCVYGMAEATEGTAGENMASTQDLVFRPSLERATGGPGNCFGTNAAPPAASSTPRTWMWGGPSQEA